MNYRIGSILALSFYFISISSCIQIKRKGVAAGSEEEKCPRGFIYVPENLNYTNLGVNEFCVSKYEMKAVSSFDGALFIEGNGGGTLCTFSLAPLITNADSRPDGTPWVCLTRDQARNECQEIGPNFDLISDLQWMVIARNIEEKDQNWDGENSADPNGMLAKGLTDNEVSNYCPNSSPPCPASTDDYAYFGTNQSPLDV